MIRIPRSQPTPSELTPAWVDLYRAVLHIMRSIGAGEEADEISDRKRGGESVFMGEHNHRECMAQLKNALGGDRLTAYGITEDDRHEAILPITWSTRTLMWWEPYRTIVVARSDLERLWPLESELPPPIPARRGAKVQHDYSLIRQIAAEERAAGSLKIVEAVRDRFEKLGKAPPSKATINRVLAHKSADN